eukprot:1475666-Pyramimonas_sp.AAC.1
MSASLTKYILNTKGAMAYETEVTAILIAQAPHIEDIMKFPLPDGVFLNKQGTSPAPSWHRLRDDEQAIDYFKR